MTQPQFDAGNFPYWSTNLLERELPIHGIAIQSSRTCSQPAFWRWSIKFLLHMDLQWYGSIRLSLLPKIAGHIHFVPGHSLSPHGCEDIFWYHRFLLFNDMIIELDDGKIYRKTLYLMVKTMVSCTMVSCKLSLKPIQWYDLSFLFYHAPIAPKVGPPTVSRPMTCQGRGQWLVNGMGWNRLVNDGRFIVNGVWMEY